MRIERQKWLDKCLLFGWFITVASMLFYACLLRFELPIGGHMFLFRAAVMVTMVIFAVKEIRDRTFFVKNLSRTEWILLITLVSMVLYGVVSIKFSLGISDWISKFLTMVIAFGFLFIYVRVGQNEKVQKITMGLLMITTAICLVGGLIECFTGCFFDTDYHDQKYIFFGKALYFPIFTFYNPNLFAVSTMFALSTLLLYAFDRFDTWTHVQKNLLLAAICVGSMLCMFLYCADQGRLTMLSMIALFIGIAIWLAVRMRKGLVWFVLSLIVAAVFILFGENYWGIVNLIQQAQNSSQILQDLPNAFGQEYNSTLTTIVDGTLVQGGEGTRIALLRNAIEMIFDSRFLGVGFGNAELRMANYTNTGGLVNVHCFFLELVLEFGIFALIPLLALFGSIFYNYYLLFQHAIRQKNTAMLTNLIFQTITVFLLPVLSTVNSSSWTIMAMWLYVGYIIIDQTNKLRLIK